MSLRIQHILDLLKLEFEDLQEDLRILEQVGYERFRRAEITEYVYKENHALFEEEIRGLKSIERLIEADQWEQFEDLDLFLAEFDQAVRQHIDTYQFPPAVHGIVSRKLKKVRDFLRD